MPGAPCSPAGLRWTAAANNPPTSMQTLADDRLLEPQWALHGLVTGHYLSRAIYVAAKLGIADLLKDGPGTSDRKHSPIGASRKQLIRMLRLSTG